MFGYASGMGMSILTFDWAQISYASSPWVETVLTRSFVDVLSDSQHRVRSLTFLLGYFIDSHKGGQQRTSWSDSWSSSVSPVIICIRISLNLWTGILTPILYVSISSTYIHNWSWLILHHSIRMCGIVSTCRVSTCSSPREARVILILIG